ncbi:Gfo/Idh/MocA family protein [Paenibacillus mendelii]|uniref:Gfo/Idh/MocA family protein n=1 Tax=Paenibacillus mendelii TaxID=206163 RepID=A0ABV6JJW5_9BACL|nr:Gfo/Idh/MocA family oxidoreductase [Paenibacillus mendelii]MCQ6559133.1 Gfo/Idh/MocA family oxidoreductase [Paenibacillus mendelii]
MRRCRAALVGINGFGGKHLDQMFQLREKGVLELVAVSEVHLSADAHRKLEGEAIKCYTDYKELLSCERELDFIVLSTPIHLHADMGIDIMEAGFNVLLEKPPAVTIQDVDRLIEASRQTGKHCAVNFQLTTGKAFNKLKEAIAGGAFGRIHTITGIGLFQRMDDYYHRTFWAGKTNIGQTFILDGTINNPLSHLLNNMIVLSGIQTGDNAQEAVPYQVTGELYHANRIDGEDTSCVRVNMNNGVTMYFYATLCHSEETMPTIRVEGEKGSAVWSYDNNLTIEIGGKPEFLAFGEENCLENVYANLIRVITGEDRLLICPVASTRNFVLISNGAYESSGTIYDIPVEHLSRSYKDGTTATVINNIDEIIRSASGHKQLFAESGVPWAVPTKPVNLSEYDKFPTYFTQEVQSD